MCSQPPLPNSACSHYAFSELSVRPSLSSIIQYFHLQSSTDLCTPTFLFKSNHAEKQYRHVDIKLTLFSQDAFMFLITPLSKPSTSICITFKSNLSLSPLSSLLYHHNPCRHCPSGFSVMSPRFIFCLHFYAVNNISSGIQNLI